MKIYLLRHGKAVSEVVDPQRPLSEEGKEEVRKVAEFLKGKNIKVSEILVSKKLRAKQTAEILKEVLKLDAGISEREELSPNYPAEVIFEELKNKTQNVLITGHLPNLAKLFSILLTGEEREIINFPSAGFCCLEKEEKNFKLSFFISPEIF